MIILLVLQYPNWNGKKNYIVLFNICLLSSTIFKYHVGDNIYFK